MGTLTTNGTWYLADLVMEMHIEDIPNNIVQKNTILIRAYSPEEAYLKALELGKQNETPYEDIEGRAVTAHLKGLAELVEVNEDLEDGAEIRYSEKVGLSEDAIEKMITRKENLAVFRPWQASSYEPKELLIAREGDTARRLEDYDRAIAIYNDALQINPQSAYVYHKRAFAHLKQGDYERAVADYDEAIRLKPQYTAAYVDRGSAFADKGDYDRAIADYNEAILLKPTSTAAYVNRGNAFANKGEYELAFKDLNEALRLDPKNYVAYYNRACVYGSLHEHDMAIGDYTEAIRLNPQYILAYNNRGFECVSKGDYDGAIADFQRVLELDPDDSDAQVIRDEISRLTNLSS